MTMSLEEMQPKQLGKETLSNLQDLARALLDSADFLNQAATSVHDDPIAKAEFQDIAAERMGICGEISAHISINDVNPPRHGTFAGAMRTMWNALRAALNAGDIDVILIEANRAETAIVDKFRQILPEIAGNPLNDKLLRHYEVVKNGRDRIKSMSDKLQTA